MPASAKRKYEQNQYYQAWLVGVHIAVPLTISQAGEQTKSMTQHVQRHTNHYYTL
jgi:hypothetical protein